MFEEYYLSGLLITGVVCIIAWIYSAVMHAKAMRTMKEENDAKLTYHKRPPAPVFSDDESRYLK